MTRGKINPVIWVLWGLVLIFGAGGGAYAQNNFLSAQEKKDFDIPKGPISTSLLDFAMQAQVSLFVQKKNTIDKISSGVKGRMSVRDALIILLKNSDLGFEYINKTTISISPDIAKINSPKIQQNQNEKPEKLRKDLGRSFTAQKKPYIEEIIITALRRETNIQKSPLAISVIKSPFLRESRIHNLEDIGSRVPGLTVSSFSLGQPTLHVRGVGSNDDGAALDNSIVMFIDDVYVGRITAINMNFFDLERIEILRGPQGTLYGKNAIGGAINITSNGPTEELSGYVGATFGNYNRFDFRAMISGTVLEDKIYGRIAFHSHKREGWQKNLIHPAIMQNAENTISSRGRMTVILNEDLKLDLNADYSRDDTGSTGRIPVVGRVPLRLVDETGQPNGKYALPTDLFSQLGGRVDLAVNSDLGFTKRTHWGLSSRFKWEKDFGTILSISAYRKNKFGWTEDAIGLPLSVTDQKINSHVAENHQQFSQEFRWLSPNQEEEKGSFHSIFGLYYLSEKTHRIETFKFPTQQSSTDQDNHTYSYAVFGETTYGVTSKFNVTIGFRLSHEVKNLNQQNKVGGNNIVLIENFKVMNKGRWTDFSPNFTLSYQMDEDIYIYGKISRGYKSGGFQGAPATKELALRVIDPESVWNYELGYKSQWFDDRFRFNLVGFFSRYSDLQVVQFKTSGNYGFFQTSNAATSSLKGIEVEFKIKPSQNFELSGSYAFLEAVYDSFNDLSGRDFTGNYLRQAPKHSLSLAFMYERNIGDGNLRLRGDYRYQSVSYREPDNSVTIQPAFGLFSASIGYLEDDWEATFWVKNLFDEQYISHIYNLGGNDYALYGTPRTFGISLMFNF